MSYELQMSYLISAAYSAVLRERSGIKSSCCGNDVSLELSFSVDRCHITLASELIMLKVQCRYFVYS